MGTMIINGESIEVSGNNIKVLDDKVCVNGKVVKDKLNGITEINFVGDIANIDCTNLTVNGDVMGNVDCTNLICNDIHGDVDATNVTANSVYGKIEL